MFARCPENPKHDRFVTVAHIVEEWVVDEGGNWIETLGSIETSVPPDSGNVWVCHICGETAEVTE